MLDIAGGDQRGRVGGFPEPERAVRGAPEVCCAESPVCAEGPACAESPAGAEELTGVGEIAGAGEN